MTEEWRDVVGYEGFYQVSNLGNIRALERKVTYTNRHGVTRTRHDKPKDIAKRKTRDYYQVTLRKDGITAQPVLHRLVAEAFIPNPEGKPQVNHKDGDKLNNSASNLEWATQSENMRHAIDVLGIPSGLADPKYCKAIIGRSENGAVSFPSLREAQRNGFNRNHIKWNIAGKYGRHKGFQWEYA